jgi:hypothetical protein
MNDLELLSRYGGVEPIDSQLIDATIEAIFDAPEPSAGAHHRFLGSRPRRLTRLVVAGASAAAVAAAALLATGAGGSSSRSPAPQVAQSQTEVLTAQVVNRSLAAVETASGYVERVVQQDSSGTLTSWRGPTQLLNEVPGHSATVWTWAAGVDTVLSVDYRHHTWSKSTFSAPTPLIGPSGTPPPPGVYLFPLKALDGPEPGATTISALFRRPGAEVIGTATIDGISTYALRIPALDAKGKPVIGKGITAWVNTSTYLPVRIAPGMTAGPDPKSTALPAWKEDFTWEPATPQNLAVFNLKPPSGFHQTTNPALQPVPSSH